MAGFLNIPDNKKTPTVKKEARRTGCETCAMFRYCKTPKIQPKGQGEILVLFGSPSAREDRSGQPYNDSYQQYLYSVLEDMGLSQDDITVAHAVQCHQKDMSPKAIEGCHYRLKRIIDNIKPERIFVCDSVAMQTLYWDKKDSRLKFSNYNIFPGNAIPDQDLGCVVTPIESPSDAVMELVKRKDRIKQSKPDSRFPKNLWEDDYLKQTDSFRVYDRLIREQIKAGLKKKWQKYTTNSFTTEDLEEAVRMLRNILDWNMFAFDIETSGLKPYAEGHFIHSWGFSDGKTAYAFPHFEDKKFLRMLRKVLTNNAKKILHNAKFEHQWIREMLGYNIVNIYWDSMIGAHLITHNGSGRSGLKYNTFAILGVTAYDSGIDSFLKGNERGANSKNNIHLAPMSDVLHYVSLDAYYTFKIAEVQMEDDDKFIQQNVQDYMKGQITLAKMERRGVKIDMIQLEKNHRKLEKREFELYDEIKNSDVVKTYWDGNSPFNPKSGAHLRQLFVDILEFPVTKYTKHGQPSTDADTLSEYAEMDIEGSNLATLVSEYALVTKVKDTFLAGIRRETDNGLLHPGFALNIAQSGRSSSMDPNFQNLPSRNKWAVDLIKSCIVPRKGYVFYDFDYKALESYMICAYSGDTQSKKELLDPDTDPHADTCRDIFGVTPEQVGEKMFATLRKFSKTFNFGIAYGGGVHKLANSIWTMHLKKEHRDILKEYLGITTYDQWEARIKKAWERYWNERYPELNEWRNSTWEGYVNTGKLYSLSGFRYTGRMTKNQVGNFGPQGSGMAVVLTAINALMDRMEELELKSRLILEIHDAIIIEAAEDEIEILNGLMQECCIDLVLEKYPWIDLPLQMSGEIFRENWATPDSEEIVVKAS